MKLTVFELKLKLQTLQPNDFDDELGADNIKRTWLTNVFWQVVTEIIDRSEDAKDHSEYELDKTSVGKEVVAMDTDLLVDEPYDELYVYYMMAQVALAYGETDDYNSYMILFNDTFDAFAKHYRRNHKPKGVKNFKYYGG